ncbi:hypothetical protein Srubr_30510 [Streptomyces rubradiris]|uniref:Uncharacterized protein n=1 Tax=Streptomyces rubradiris TaxID=285531 RepID=A0ABQ3RBK1_STRRR|nr:hypothetical protein GCM10018792_70920 [Streptomyces rubradiris]GHI53205.1 hypothetical protein Srubr_30510 [Streptomyces rubradiris]
MWWSISPVTVTTVTPSMVDRRTDSRSGPACSFICAVSATRFLVSLADPGPGPGPSPPGSAAGLSHRPYRAVPRAFLSGRLPRIARKMPTERAALRRVSAHRLTTAGHLDKSIPYAGKCVPHYGIVGD